MKISPEEVALLHADGKMDGRTDPRRLAVPIRFPNFPRLRCMELLCPYFCRTFSKSEFLLNELLLRFSDILSSGGYHFAYIIN